MSVLLLVLLLLLIAINGFFVAAEFALVRTRRGKVEQLAEEGDVASEAVVEQLDKIEESLSACQIGVTIASIGIGFLGEPSLSKLIEPLFGGLSHGVAAALSLAIAFIFVTAIHNTIGERGSPRRAPPPTPREPRVASPNRSTGSASRPRR
jgi:CBS domain containing-hemolysin-like protein